MGHVLAGVRHRVEAGYGPPLGLDGLAAGCRVEPDRAGASARRRRSRPGRRCVAAGAAGVAVMGAVMSADDPAAVVRASCEACSRRVEDAER